MPTPLRRLIEPDNSVSRELIPPRHYTLLLYVVVKRQGRPIQLYNFPRRKSILRPKPVLPTRMRRLQVGPAEPRDHHVRDALIGVIRQDDLGCDDHRLAKSECTADRGFEVEANRVRAVVV